MANPKKDIKQARKTLRREHKNSKVTFKATKKAVDARFQSRSGQINKLFQQGSVPYTESMRQAALQRRDDLDIAKHQMFKEKAVSTQAFSQMVKQVPLRYLNAKELRTLRLPQSQQRYLAAKQRFDSAKRTETLLGRQETSSRKNDKSNQEPVGGSVFRSQRGASATSASQPRSQQSVQLKQASKRFVFRKRVEERASGENVKSVSQQPEYSPQLSSAFTTKQSSFQDKGVKQTADTSSFHGTRLSVNGAIPQPIQHPSKKLSPLNTRGKLFVFRRQQERRKQEVDQAEKSVSSRFQYNQTKSDFIANPYNVKQTGVTPGGEGSVPSRFSYKASSNSPKVSSKVFFKGNIAAKSSYHVNLSEQVSMAKGTSAFSNLQFSSSKKGQSRRHTNGKDAKTTASGRFFYGQKEKSAEFYEAKKEFNAAKSELKATKKTYQKKRLRGKLARTVRILRNGMIDLMADDDVMQGAQDIRDTVRQTKHYSKFTYKGSKGVVRGTKNVAVFTKNRAVNITERTRNLAKGKGFTLNNKNRHISVRMKQYFSRLKTNSVKGIKGGWEFLKNAPSHFMKLLASPKGWILLGGVFLLLLNFSVFLSVLASNVVQQDEFELNKSYLHMTWEDSEHTLKSPNGTTYFTKVDDVMVYMNYKFQDYELNEQTEWYSLGYTYKHYLSDLWIKLNEEDGIKSMKDLYDVDPYTLTAEEQEELEEMKEEGAYSTLQELDNPFQGQTEDDVITMAYRFGYYGINGESTLQDYVIFQANQDQVIIAPTDGQILVDGEDIILVNGSGRNESRLTFFGIADGSVANNFKVYGGEAIGKVKDPSGLKISYQKYDVDEKSLVYVNPAFYFPKVVQLQTTIIPSIGQFQGDEVGRAKAVYEYMKSKGASDQFIAAVLGNWSIESGITAKRAKGDYLSPPIGATETSWDDDNWLNMSGPEIYNGAHSNILHRGLGLGQWTDTADGAIRNTLLRAYAKSNNKKWYDLELQLDFMFNGDSPYYTSWVEQHKADTGSPASLAQLFLTYWEGNSGDKLVERQTRAVEWYYQIQKGFSNPGSGTAQVDVKALEQIREHLMDGVTPGGGDDMGYPWGQCTWGVAKRINQLGLKLEGRDGSKIPIISTMGNGMDWVNTASSLGGKTGSVPKEGAIVSFDLNDGYGHVAFVEKVFADGSFLISETNYNGSADNPTGVITFRTFSAVEGNMSFAYTTK